MDDPTTDRLRELLKEARAQRNEMADLVRSTRFDIEAWVEYWRESLERPASDTTYRMVFGKLREVQSSLEVNTYYIDEEV